MAVLARRAEWGRRCVRQGLLFGRCAFDNLVQQELHPIALAVAPDFAGTNADEVVILARPSNGAVKVVIKRASSGQTVKEIGDDRYVGGLQWRPSIRRRPQTRAAP